MNILSKAQGFVIYDKEKELYVNPTGLFLTLTPVPKIWGKLNGVKTHLRRFVIRGYGCKGGFYVHGDLYKKKSIVVYDVSTNEEVLNVSHFLLEECERKNVLLENAGVL